jgi:hypothetical protein
MGLAREIARFGAGLRAGGWPAAVDEKLRVCPVDSFGMALAMDGLSQPSADGSDETRHRSGSAAHIGLAGAQLAKSGVPGAANVRRVGAEKGVAVAAYDLVERFVEALPHTPVDPALQAFMPAAPARVAA